MIRTCVATIAQPFRSRKMRTLPLVTLALGVALSTASAAEQKKKIPTPGGPAGLVNPVELKCEPYKASTRGRVYRVSNPTSTPILEQDGWTVCAESIDPADSRRVCETGVTVFTGGDTHELRERGGPSQAGRCRAWFYAGLPDLVVDDVLTTIGQQYCPPGPSAEFDLCNTNDWVTAPQSTLRYSFWIRCPGEGQTFRKLEESTKVIPRLPPNTCWGRYRPAPGCSDFCYRVTYSGAGASRFVGCDIRAKFEADALHQVRESNEGNNERWAGSYHSPTCVAAP